MKRREMGKVDVTDLLVSPKTGKTLHFDASNDSLVTDEEIYFCRDDVWLFLDKPNEAYEGSYLNKVNYLPRKDRFPYTIPLWMMVNGYVWVVRQQFKKGVRLCELGCASGVNYFGQHFSMVGIDYSFRSLRGIENYELKIQADAIRLPFKDASLDGIISSYFWEHILPSDKEIMLKEFHRVLIPGGKVVMLYDVETQNRLIEFLKHENLEKYEELFLHGDYHIGYETIEENKNHFKKASFKVIKHFGMERTFFQSNSVYVKLSTCSGGHGWFSRMMRLMTSSGPLVYIYMMFVRLVDTTVGRLFPERKSRIAISVLQKEK